MSTQINYTRLDTMMGVAGMLRRMVAEAVHHARHRSAFGALLADQPLMQSVLADLALESEAMTAVVHARRALLRRRRRAAVPPVRHRDHEVLDLASAGRSRRPRRSSASAATASSRSRSCPSSSATSRSARSGRARATSPRSTCCARWRASPRACRRSWTSASSPLGGERACSTRISRAPRQQLGSLDGETVEWRARRLVEDLAVALQASLLVRHAPPAVADAFCAARLGDGGRAFGTLPARRRRGRDRRARARGLRRSRLSA